MLVLIILCTSSSFAQEKKLFLAGAPLDGYQAQIIAPLLREAFKRNNIRIKIESTPSARSLEMTNSGMADGELHRVYDFHAVSEGKYPNLIRIESRMMSVYLAVFSKNKTPVSSWKALKGHTVAYQRGRQNVQHELTAYIREEYIKPKNSDLIAFRMLANKRVDYVVSESFEGARLISQHPELEGLHEVGRLAETKIYSYMHIKHKELAKAIATTLENMKQDGTNEVIVSDVRNRLLSGN